MAVGTNGRRNGGGGVGTPVVPLPTSASGSITVGGVTLDPLDLGLLGVVVGAVGFTIGVLI